MMALNLDDVIEGLDTQRRRGVEERAAQLIAKELTQRELRETWRLTQVNPARELGIADPVEKPRRPAPFEPSEHTEVHADPGERS
jgi:hypothetical protein